MKHLLLSLFLSTYALASMGSQSRNQIISEMITPLYGAWPQEQLIVVGETAPFELNDGSGRYQEWLLASPRDLTRVLRLGLFLPLVTSPSFTLLTLNKCGNHTLHSDPRIPEGSLTFRHKTHCKKSERSSHSSKYGVEQLLKAGLGLATFAEADIDADSAQERNIGIKSLYLHSWGTLSAWAWGLSQASNHLIQNGVTGIITTGHSRRGKAALLAAALDESIYGSFPHQSGTGGTASLNADFRQESLGSILFGNFLYKIMGEGEGLTHFFNPSFADVYRRSRRLDFDAHDLIVLMAPRLLVDFQGKKDHWAGPKSARRMLETAANAWPQGELQRLSWPELTTFNSQLAYILFPWNHKQDEAFWESVIEILRLHSNN